MDNSLERFIPRYPLLNEDDVQGEVERKKEFYIHSLPKTELLPDEPGGKLKHQKLLANILSSYTLYDNILLYHSMGTGKSIAAITIGEKLLSEGIFKRVIVLLKGENYKRPFIDEIHKATINKYYPTDDTGIDPAERIKAINKNLNKYYTITTTETFAKSINLGNIKKYENSVIIIDEVHNLGVRGQTDRKTYETIHSFVHSIRNKKLIIMSGTPVQDKPEELATVMNLVLPLNKQLPTGKTFANQYLELIEMRDGDYEKEGLYRLKNIEELKSKLMGFVSYLKNMSSDVNKEFIGEYMGKYESFKIYQEIMEPHQESGYKYAKLLDSNETGQFKVVEGAIYVYTESETFSKKLFKQHIQKVERKRLETGGKGIRLNSQNIIILGKEDFDEIEGTATNFSLKRGIYSNVRQASMFVFEDGSFGENGAQKYMEIISKDNVGSDIQNILRKSGVSTNKVVNYRLNMKISRIEDIKKYSIKYYNVIKSIMKPRENCFIYSNLISGSGSSVLVALLNKFGFKQSVGNEATKGLRYIYLTSDTTPDQINRRIRYFNKKQNRYGEYVKVIIGSRLISEGYTFKNVQQIHILTPHWHFSEIDQAMARAIRLFGHQFLIDDGMNPIVKIWLHTAIEQNNIKTIDYNMYLIAEAKDITIKQIDHVLKEVSVDCNLTYRRNIVADKSLNYTRDCEYGSCDYDCESSSLVEDELDVTTYDLYYNEFENVIEIIQTLFKTRFYYKFDELLENIGVSSNELLHTLYKIIHLPISMMDKYNRICYLHEDEDMYYITPSIFSSSFLESYYDMYIFSKYTPDISNIISSNYISKLSTVMSINFFKKLNVVLQEAILENYILNNNIVKEELREEYEEYYFTFIIKKDNLLISKLITPYRCMNTEDGSVWRNCNENENEIIDNYKRYLENELIENNPFGMYGILEGDVFKIRDVSDKEKLMLDDIKSRPKGESCKTLNKNVLADYILRSTMEYEILPKRNTIEKVDAWLKKKGWYKEKFSESDRFKLSYWLDMSNVKICPRFLKWFEKNNLILR